MTYKEIYQRFTGDILPKDGVGIVVFLENGDRFAYILELIKEECKHD